MGEMCLPSHLDVANVIAVFRRNDTSGTGTVPRDELKRLLQVLVSVDASSAELLLCTLLGPGTAPVRYVDFVQGLFRPPQHDLGDPDFVFDCCDTELPGWLDEHELRFALNAFGLFPSQGELSRRLGRERLLGRSAFKALLQELLPGSVRGARTVPYALRGVSLGQLRNLHSAFVESCWLQRQCNEFNGREEERIAAGELHPLQQNLYALDRFVVRPATAPGGGLEERLRRAAGLPHATRYCSYSELVNPEGARVDYFVSHWWGHPFSDTMQALSSWARRSHGGEPAAVVFWLCIFALNQHHASEEVGASPEKGPFNAALVRARGAIMVLDEHVYPFQRIWCLYEVSRLTALGKDFEMVCSHGPVAELLRGHKESKGTVLRIEEALEEVSAFAAQASSDEDKNAIWHRVADPFWRRKDLTLLRQHKLWGDNCFKRFDMKIRGLLATPLLQARLSCGDPRGALRAVGLGARFTRQSFEELRRLLHGDLCQVELPVKRGKQMVNWTLLHCAAFFGHLEAAECLLEAHADIGVTTRFGFTPLHLAASNGQVQTLRLLLGWRADHEASENNSRTVLQSAAVSGHTESVRTLLEHGANISAEDDKGQCSLYAATLAGHTEVVDLLLAKRACIFAKTKKGSTLLHAAVRDNFADVVERLIRHSEAIGAKEALLSATFKGQTPLDLAKKRPSTEAMTELLR